jgi:predicted nucleotidyltransferase
MLSDTLIREAAKLLEQAAPEGSRVLLFGSYATGSPHPRSDVDFMVIEPQVGSWLRETDRLYRSVRHLRLPIDLLVTTAAVFEQKKADISTIYHEAFRGGRVMHAVE